MKNFIYLTILLIFATLAAQCGPAASSSQGGGITVSDISARATTQNGAVYMTFTNGGASDDVLIGAKTDVAKTVELHETKMDENDVMKMSPVPNIPIPAGGSVTLKPGGLHIMLIDMQKELAVGDKISLTLTFEKAGPMTIEAEVKDAAMGQMDHGEAAPPADHSPDADHGEPDH
ncbi:MAG: copper chaperone PCu(A)C [Anaerolineae bacterium]|nr:copper chaperone PCu(A)C [Anaerolineae bacterium]